MFLSRCIGKVMNACGLWMNLLQAISYDIAEVVELLQNAGADGSIT
jgi:hypothetical protein